MFKKRHKMSKGKSRKMFTRTASMSHRRNAIEARPMRGGIRL